jgi:hypothetical protein
VIVGPATIRSWSRTSQVEVPPYARLVPGAAKVPDDRIVPTLMDQRFDYSRIVLLPFDAPVVTLPLDSIPAPMAAGKVSATIAKKAGRKIPIRSSPTCQGVWMGAVIAFPRTYETAVMTITATWVPVLVLFRSADEAITQSAKDFGISIHPIIPL